MSQWYYSDAQRQPQGPIEVADLLERQRRGLVNDDTLVWRDGLPDWRPWRELKHEVIGSVAAAGGPTSAWPVAGEDRESPYRAPLAERVDAGAEFLAGGPVVYGGFLKRFAAAFIDNFIATMLGYVFLLPLMFLMMGGAAFGTDGAQAYADGLSVAFILLTYAIMLGVPAVYFGWLQASSWQATVGKLAVGVKVVRSDGSAIGFWRGFLRYFAYVLSGALTCGIGFVVSALMSGLSERKQALHDLICDTLVVDKHAFTPQQHLQSEELGTVTVVILIIAVLSMVGLLALYGLIFAAAMSARG